MTNGRSSAVKAPVLSKICVGANQGQQIPVLKQVSGVLCAELVGFDTAIRGSLKVLIGRLWLSAASLLFVTTGAATMLCR